MIVLVIQADLGSPLFLLLMIFSPTTHRADSKWEHAAAKSLQSCPTLCNPIDGSPPGSPVPGILQARTLEWVATSFSNAWKWKVKVKSFNHVQLLATAWTAAYQIPPSMGFSRQKYWSGFHKHPLVNNGWVQGYHLPPFSIGETALRLQFCTDSKSSPVRFSLSPTVVTAW